MKFSPMSLSIIQEIISKSSIAASDPNVEEKAVAIGRLKRELDAAIKEVEQEMKAAQAAPKEDAKTVKFPPPPRTPRKMR